MSAATLPVLRYRFVGAIIAHLGIRGDAGYVATLCGRSIRADDVVRASHRWKLCTQCAGAAK